MDLQDQRDALLIDLAESLKREDKAKSDERDACAQIADDEAFALFGEKKKLMKRLAASIRARSNAEITWRTIAKNEADGA
jgi:hypothetical protein